MIGIDIENLYEGENVLEFDSEDLKSIDFKDLKVERVNSLQLNISARNRYLYVTGTNNIKLKFDCDRCAEESTLDYKVELEYVFFVGDIGKGDTADVIIIDEDAKKIDLDPYYLESVQLAIPFIQLCDENCKGICVKCGANLNEIECACSKEKPIDSRWEKLADIARKMKDDEQQEE